jgi:hypothetical protein
MASHESALKTASYACALKRARERVSQLLSKRGAIALTITVPPCSLLAISWHQGS